MFYEPSGAELVYAAKQLAQIQLALQCSAKIIHCPRCNGQYTAAADEPIVSICPACQSSMMFLVTTTKYCNNEVLLPMRFHSHIKPTIFFAS